MVNKQLLVTIPADLKIKLKIKALEKEKTLNNLVTELLKESVEK